MKENRPSFVNRQHDAERVEFGDGFDPTQHAVAGPSTAVHIDSPRSSGKKRGAATQTTEELSEDEGFEEDNRAAIAAEAAQRRLQAQARADPARPHARFSSPPEAPSPKRRSGPFEGPSPRKRQRTEGERQFSVSNRGSSEPEDPEAEELIRSGWAANYRSTQNQAKAKVARTINKRQTRVKWTEAEIEALIDYVEEHDTQWAEIKRIDGVNGILADRDQVGLKDKARNMLMDWLKYVTCLSLAELLRVKTNGNTDLELLASLETSSTLPSVLTTRRSLRVLVLMRSMRYGGRPIVLESKCSIALTSQPWLRRLAFSNGLLFQHDTHSQHSARVYY